MVELVAVVHPQLDWGDDGRAPRPAMAALERASAIVSDHHGPIRPSVPVGAAVAPTAVLQPEVAAPPPALVRAQEVVAKGRRGWRRRLRCNPWRRPLPSAALTTCGGLALCPPGSGRRRLSSLRGAPHGRAQRRRGMRAGVGDQACGRPAGGPGRQGEPPAPWLGLAACGAPWSAAAARPRRIDDLLFNVGQCLSRRPGAGLTGPTHQHWAMRGASCGMTPAWGPGDWRLHSRPSCGGPPGMGAMRRFVVVRHVAELAGSVLVTPRWRCSSGW